MGQRKSTIQEIFARRVNPHGYPNFFIQTTPEGKVEFTCIANADADHKKNAFEIVVEPQVAKDLSAALQVVADAAPKPKRIRKPKVKPESREAGLGLHPEGGEEKADGS